MLTATPPVMPARRLAARRVAAFAAVLTLGFGGCLTLATAASAGGAPVTGAGESQFVADTNAARASVGKAAYAVRDDLVAVARQQASRMAARGTIYHNPNLASDVTNWRFVGENVGMGPSVDSIQQAFMHSTEHRNNIEDSDFTEFGVGTVTNPDGTIFVSVVFRDPLTATAPAPAAPVQAPAPAAAPVVSGSSQATTTTPAAATTTTAAAATPTAEQLLATRLAEATQSAAKAPTKADTLAQAMNFADLLTHVSS